MTHHRTSRETNGQIPNHTRHVDPAGVDETPRAERSVPEPTPPAPAPAHVPATRTGAAWVALAAATLLAVLLIVFLVQNTRDTEISFLWMTTSTPLAVALLIAAVGSVLITMVLGTARISQLRRRIRKQRR